MTTPLPRTSCPSLVALAPQIGEYWTDVKSEKGLDRLLESVLIAPRSRL